MFRTILVPLDRSQLAEQALPWAFAIARRADARLDLAEVHRLYSLEEPSACWAPFQPDQDAECKRQEQLYLDATATWMNSVSPLSITTGLLAGSAVLPEMVAESVLERASAVSADLIVIATHGRGTLSRLVYGSVAHELVRRSNVPVLLIPLGESAPQLVPEPQFTNVLIPLDGSPLAEKVLSPAFDLARLMEARCTLVRVLESDSRPADPALGWVQAQRYLDRIAGRIQGGSLDIRTRLAASARVATTIREQAEREPGSIIAIATHGWGGFRQLLLGSVAEQLIQNASSPILAYRPADRG